ncbi:uncharacterized protein TNIN_308181 [Trichonephila inaurata madagascariensis]|uniref:Uncharacterized protein n=1 Tax=Trichonephila inaurata madagascariensis TaxID=2747483 RepID=A0A8X7CQ94_9ARAC|nr:uncharacterized protein TNIN_308181 [Trichonephila inaurata madagascariensis]
MYTGAAKYNPELISSSLSSLEYIVFMEKILLLLCLATVCTAIFFPFFNLPTKNQNVMNVCIYSVDPSRYMPKCFLCPTNSYASVLQTCVQAAAIPSNVSYTQANCIEQNCAVRRGKRSIATDEDGAPDNSFNRSEPSGPLFEGAQLHQLGPLGNSSLNYGSNRKDLIIVGTVESNAMDVDNTELLLEYEVDSDDGQ